MTQDEIEAALKALDAPQSVEQRCAALCVHLSILRRAPVQVTIDDDGCFELAGDWITTRNLVDICLRLEALIGIEEAKSKGRQLGLTNFVAPPKVPKTRKARTKKTAVPKATAPSARVALGMSQKQIAGMFTVGDHWTINDSSNGSACGYSTITKVTATTVVRKNYSGDWTMRLPAETDIIEVRDGYLHYNIADCHTVEWTKKNEA